jgi:hypothetical protein
MAAASNGDTTAMSEAADQLLDYLTIQSGKRGSGAHQD